MRKRVRYIQCELSEPLSTSRALGLLDPLTVVWEIIPYSFVVDWFLPIGSYLENLAVFPFLEGRFLTTDVYRYSGFDIKPIKFVNPPAVVTILEPRPRQSYKRTVMTRTVSTSLSVPRPAFDNSGLHGRRVYNAIALAFQAFTGSKPPIAERKLGSVRKGRFENRFGVLTTFRS
jgi:hypothetical protein